MTKTQRVGLTLLIFGLLLMQIRFGNGGRYEFTCGAAAYVAFAIGVWLFVPDNEDKPTP